MTDFVDKSNEKNTHYKYSYYFENHTTIGTNKFCLYEKKLGSKDIVQNKRTLKVFLEEIWNLDPRS